MKLLLLKGISLDSTYNFTVNTTDWIATIAEYLGKTRAELVGEINSAPDFNFAFIDTIAARCRVDLCTFGDPNPVYTYAITYDGTTYKHWFIDMYDFVRSSIVRETSVYDISFSLNLIAEFSINSAQAWDCFVNKTHAKPTIEDDFFARLGGESGAYETALPSSFSFKTTELLPPEFSDSPTYPIVGGIIVVSTQRYGDSLPFRTSKYQTPYYLYFFPDSPLAIGALGNTTTNVQQFIIAAQETIVKAFYCPILPLGAGIVSTSLAIQSNNGTAFDIDSIHYQCIYIESTTTTQTVTTMLYRLPSNIPTSSNPLDYSPYTQLKIIAGSKVFAFENNYLRYIEFKIYLAIDGMTLVLIPHYTRNAYSLNGAHKSESHEVLLQWEIPMTSNEWRAYVAQNKNYLFMGVGAQQELADINAQQRASERQTAAYQAGINAVAQIGGGLVSAFTGTGNGAGGILSGIASAGNAALQNAQQEKNEEFEAQRVDLSIRKTQASWDNIQARPDKVKSLGYNVSKALTLATNFNGFIMYLDTLAPALKAEREREIFRYGIEANTRRAFNTLFERQNFNYISLNELLFTRLNLPASLLQKIRLNDIFTAGITFIEQAQFVENGVEYPSDNPYKE